MGEKSTADPKNIREMNIETDLDQVKKIWLKWVEKTAHPLKSGESWKSKLPNLEREIQDCKNQKYVYEENGKIKGFIVGGVLNGSPYLYELYVDDQRKGIGTKLLDKLRKTYRYLTTDVYKNNRYLKFYQDRGFEVYDERQCPDTGEIKLRIRW